MSTKSEALPTWVRLTPRERLRSGLAVLGALVVLGVALLLTPDPRGLGTHEQLGLPPCMTFRFLGIPCPFCGMTTAFSLMAHGRPAQAFYVQPVGAIAFLAAILYLAFFLMVTVSGRFPTLLRDPTVKSLAWRTGIGVVTVAWLYKITIHLHLI